MAYMTKGGKGPYPCHAGDYCGNYMPSSPASFSFDQSPLEARRQHETYLASMRFGRPHPCGDLTVAETMAEGWVGLYLKKDDLARPPDVLIDTPPELLEPPDPEEASDARVP